MSCNTYLKVTHRKVEAVEITKEPDMITTKKTLRVTITMTLSNSSLDNSKQEINMVTSNSMGKDIMVAIEKMLLMTTHTVQLRRNQRVKTVEVGTNSKLPTMADLEVWILINRMIATSKRGILINKPALHQEVVVEVEVQTNTTVATSMVLVSL